MKLNLNRVSSWKRALTLLGCLALASTLTAPADALSSVVLPSALPEQARPFGLPDGAPPFGLPDSAPLPSLPSAAELSGSGEFGDIVLGGTLSPGYSPGLMLFDNLSFLDTSSLLIELGGLEPGTEFDRIEVENTVTFAGVMEVALLYDFLPSLGDAFEIITFGTRVGEFDEMLGLDLSNGLTLAPVYDAHSLSLVAAGGPASVSTVVQNPEPGTALLLGLGLLLLASRRTPR